MKKIVLLLFVFFFTLAPQAFAHVLKTDGSIGAVLHVSPEDDPIAGEASNFYFEFKDTKKQFDPSKCDCVITVYQSGKEIYSQNLFENSQNPSLSSASFAYTFPEKDVYQIQVKGTHESSKKFQPFTLSYDVRVAKDSNTAVKTDESSLIVGWVLAGVVLFFIIIYILKRVKKGGVKK